MIVLSEKYVGLFCICEGCGALIAKIQPSDIYADNLLYCPLCKHQNKLNYNKNYDGIVKENKENV